jgi:uncharacterized protein YbjT (DUF2867 family)
MRTAIVIGATGVTGKHITRSLLDSSSYSSVVVFSRRALSVQHAKLINHVVDFDALADWAHLVQGDDLFSALGTTVKQAGSQEAQYQVDYGYQAGVIEAAASNSVRRLFLVSSPQASTGSWFFYTRMKAELDVFAAQQGFETLVYFKPSIILGDRPDSRPGEKISGVLAQQIAWMPGLKKYRPISGEQLGRAMVNCATRKLDPGIYTYELDDIFALLE